jgi:tetratricopeptide (TPR) repeat protein
MRTAHRRCGPLALTLGLLAGGLWVGRLAAQETPLDIQGERSPFVARQLIQRARALYRKGDETAAKQLAAQAIRTDPTYATSYTFLGFLHDHAGNKPQAIAYYVEAIKNDPNGQQGDYARQRLAFVFHEGAFPRRLRGEWLPYAPTQFLLAQCRLPGIAPPGAPAPTRAFAYTVSPLFTDTTLVILPPGQDEKTPEYRRSFNREVCGFVEDPQAGELVLRFLLRYPSANLSLADETLTPRDDTPLAHRLMPILLRCYWYAKAYLDLEPSYPEVKVWLCEEGLAGGEWLQDNVYLYAKPQARAPIEWIREIAHEYGHMVLPAIGGYERPEHWANGELGERLFIKWLVQEAETKAGQQLPGAEAQTALNARWEGVYVDGESYLNNRYRRVVKFWFDQGPDSELLMGRDEPAMEYFLGFALYAEAAHGLPVLKQVFAAREGDTAADFLNAYKRTIAGLALQDKFELNASAYVPAAGALPPWPTSGPTVPLQGLKSLRYVLYLPAGRWRLEPVGDPGLEVEVKRDDEVLGRARTGAPGVTGQVALDLPAGRWNTLELTFANPRPASRFSALRVHPGAK